MPADAPKYHPEPDGPGDDDLIAALAGAGEEFSTAPEPLIAAGLARGRRSRRRRTAAFSVGLAAVVLAGTGGALLLSPGAERSVVVPGAGSGASGPFRLGFTDQQLIHSFEAALPHGRITGATATLAQGTGAAAGPSIASVVFDDGAGPAEINAVVERLPVGGGSRLNCAGTTFISCVISSRPDGGRVQESMERAPAVPGSDAATGIVRREVLVEYPDGRLMVVTELNAPDSQGPKSRTDPPLSFDRLLAVADDQQAWSVVWRGVPVVPAVPPWTG
ncbi:hypothetical protein [Kitasatospora sp. LaBMicrA B282]|uniref:hypothetical protein n=1 Tax=Kitasatospora sp. LaBMicrA B282 TaxID=3420949 RepID=UPI003D0B70E5